MKLAFPEGLFAVGIICTLSTVRLAIPEGVFAVGVICSCGHGT